MTRPDATKVLSILTSLVGTISFSCLFLAIVTDHWLYTLEKTPGFNGTFVVKATRSGLWKKCPEDPASSTCLYINYFDQVDRDGLGSTESILLSLRRATVFPMLSVTVSFAGQIFCYVSSCHSGTPFRSIATFTASVLFIVSGLSLFVGFIIYIGAVTEEAANRSKSKDDPAFVYRYGPSLLLIVASFFASEMAGVMAIHLFISLRRQIQITDKLHLQRPSIDPCATTDATPVSAQAHEKPAGAAATAAAALLRYPSANDASAWTIGGVSTATSSAPATAATSAAAAATTASSAVTYSDTACSTPCRRQYPFYLSQWNGEFNEEEPPASNGHTGLATTGNWVEDEDPDFCRRITPV